MDLAQELTKSPLILTEAAVIERLRRGNPSSLNDVHLHAACIYHPDTRRLLADVWREYLGIAGRTGLPILFGTATWRAGPRAISKELGSVEQVNRDNTAFGIELRDEARRQGVAALLGGLVGPMGDAYDPRSALAQEEARLHHAPQTEALAGSGVDFIHGATFPALSEALGLAQAVAETGTPLILSFIIDSVGRLLDGTPLEEAIQRIDDPCPPLCYLVNCVHPAVLESALENHRDPKALTKRLWGLQGNASRLPPEELDGADRLDSGDPEEFGKSMVRLHTRYGLRILGGCCGTDGRHLQAIVKALKRKGRS